MIKLPERARDQLRSKLRLWKEELAVHGAAGTGRSTMTQKSIGRLEKRIAKLYSGIEALNVEYRRIMEM